MAQENKPDLYAVMGNPIAHSQSPFIHHEFAKQTQQNIRYEKILVPVTELAQAINDFKARGGKGLNLTLPFKQEAKQLVSELSEAAKLAGAINTLRIEQDYLFGTNTDGIGLVRDLTLNYGLDLTNKTILILGAGGAARGCLLPLLQLKLNALVISNRTVAKSEALADEFSAYGPITSLALENLAQQQYDLIINATSASLQGAVPTISEKIITPETHCYDMVYGPSITPFLAFAAQHKANSIMDGLGMLVEQAAEAFYLWRNVRPETKSVAELLRKRLQPH